MFGTLSFNTDTDTSIRACDNCRLRKVKCPNVSNLVKPINGKFQPCAKCTEQALCCTYDRMAKKKGPKVSPKTLDLVLNQPWELTDQIATVHFEKEQQFVVNSSPPPLEIHVEQPNQLLSTALTSYFQNNYTTYPIIDLADDNESLLQGLRLANMIHSYKNGVDNVTQTSLLDQVQQIHLNRLSNPSDSVTLHSVCDSIFIHMAMTALGNTNKAMVYLSEAHSYYFLCQPTENEPRRKRINCILTSLRLETGAHHLSTEMPSYSFDELTSLPYYGPLAHLCDDSYNHQVISLLLWHTAMCVQRGHYFSSKG
ncbi:hypothetical protein B0I72DRAFT_139811 [Yarrowia lipolytica]|uniref:Uncharacterized protein n=1 Tax=Yarrowia lipolytica TaxID=4952 RepID=A0A1D8NAC5_YARLL|nr:hypothetical protein YALI1_C13162g [Yarrowia lipolytica]KAB8280762.1 hypothetical protein BKA91DRAFT_40532 [Yarrowia lipolytica]KAE8169861.1 hypothetical protein BKA90DRAFT_43856 [Yarrowia lipolytica]KAJ8053260.1 hypothetical protein LXG23DRAFT_23093 [Yarrowia lipolytica]QNP96525.1 Hypothetical protein YALI2_C00178g [Yarrowia lipolytica]